MSKFAIFRKKMDNEAQCRLKFEQRFITEGASAIDIHIVRLDVDRNASMVISEAEGPDSAIVFTPKQATKIDNLLKSDYFIWDGKMFFVYEDVLIPREVSYIKQKAYQCNVKVLCDEEECGGYFISSLRTYVDTELQKNINIADKEQPILIMPMNENIKVGTKLSIGDKPWKVIDMDNITNTGILYISLERDFYTKSDNIIENYEPNVLKSGIEYDFKTSDAYFNTSTPLQIKSRRESTIRVLIPYGITEVDISTKIDNEIKTTKYKVEV